MTEIIIDCPEDLACLYFRKVEKEIPRLVSCKEIEARVSVLIVKDLETLHKQREIKKDKRIFKDNEYERV